MNHYPWHHGSRRLRYTVAAGALAVSSTVWLVTSGDEGVWPRLITSLGAVVAGALLIEQETYMDAAAGLVYREGRILGRVRIWKTQHSTKEFRGVLIDRHLDAEGTDTVFVGLKRLNGRFMAVRYFHALRGQPSVEAENTARSIAHETGLPWIDNPQ